jgi:hypothetical protein
LDFLHYFVLASAMAVDANVQFWSSTTNVLEIASVARNVLKWQSKCRALPNTYFCLEYYVCFEISDDLDRKLSKSSPKFRQIWSHWSVPRNTIARAAKFVTIYAIFKP